MERWSIYCKKCGKFILTEEKDAHNEIHCVAGSYEDGYYLVDRNTTNLTFDTSYNGKYNQRLRLFTRVRKK